MTTRAYNKGQPLNPSLFYSYYFKLCPSIAPISYRNINNQGDHSTLIETNLLQGHVKKLWLTFKTSKNNFRKTLASLKESPPNIHSAQVARKEEILANSHVDKCKNPLKKWLSVLNQEKSATWYQPIVAIILSYGQLDR